jgi:hypothetical protein
MLCAMQNYFEHKKDIRRFQHRFDMIVHNAVFELVSFIHKYLQLSSIQVPPRGEYNSI